MNENKSKNSKVRVNINELLRIGSIMERSNIQQQSREAFDWLAENRNQMDSNPKNFANHLITAVGELIMSKELVKQVMERLIKEEMVTLNEYERNFRRFEGSSDELLPTVMLISYIIKKKCSYFQTNAI